jgi:ribosomal protein S18 acetylase RimI-like enzyme
MLTGVTELRLLGSDDWQLWRRLRLAALAEAPRAFGSRLADWQGENDREERWRARLDIAESHNLVAVLDGEPVGMASGLPGSDGTVELISMWVAPSARGRGVADALVREVERWARASGARVLRLDVAEDNAAAQAVYARHGFALTGELGDLMADGIRHEWVMAKALSAPAAPPVRP